jgi:hypothetical protein
MELRICMIPSPKDPPWISDDYQSDLRNLGRCLRDDGLEIDDVGARFIRAGFSPAISGEWRVKLCDTLGPVLGAPVGSWLQARDGRTIHLIIGEIEVDVRTAEELLCAIKIARFYQESAESDC